ncbi:MAG TPA: 2-phosphosulfolactate phosphatase [Motilibacteraceae bacterium]|nr:2-phosphosulfolactate phosphatase [Motilibacteraceae bacterium]
MPEGTGTLLDVELEWGPAGARLLAARCDVLVVVDVLSFTTALTVAAARGVTVWPYGSDVRGGAAGGAEALADAVGAQLAHGRSASGGPTLSPASLLHLPEGSRLVLPSPNGSAIAHAAVADGATVVGASLRNSAAVARWLVAREGRQRVGLVPAGERHGDGTLRPCYEDLLGAGTLLGRLAELGALGAISPLAAAARAGAAEPLPLASCPSGVELVERGFARDVELAGQVDVDDVVPVLVDGRFVPERG